MLFIEFLFSFPAAFFALLVAVILFKTDSPVFEMKILSLSNFFACILFTGMTISALVHTPNTVALLGVVTHRIGFIFAQFALILMSFAIILPNYKASYRSIFVICTITAINVASALINGLTIDHVVVGEYIRVTILPLGRFFFAISLLLFLATPAVRIIEISRVMKYRFSPFTSTRFLSIFLLLMTISLSLILIENIMPYPNDIPGFTWLLPMSLENIYFIYSFQKDRAFFFITPARLEAVIITNQVDGGILFSRIFREFLPVEILVGSLFSALKDSFLKSDQDKSGVEQINFGDKVVLLAPGSRVTTLMIVTESNFVTVAVSKYLTHEFEKQFHQKLQTVKITDSNVFREFETVIKRIQMFIPRSSDLSRDALTLTKDDKFIAYSMIQKVYEGIKQIQRNMQMSQEQAESTQSQMQVSIQNLIDFIERADLQLLRKDSK